MHVVLSYDYDLEHGEWDDGFKRTIEKFDNSGPSDIEIVAFQVLYNL